SADFYRWYRSRTLSTHRPRLDPRDRRRAHTPCPSRRVPRGPPARRTGPDRSCRLHGDAPHRSHRRLITAKAVTRPPSLVLVSRPRPRARARLLLGNARPLAAYPGIGQFSPHNRAPPSTYKVAPVTNSAPGDNKSPIAAATSSSVPNRFI